MNYLFRDEMYQPYGPVIEDRKRYEYARYEADGVNILDNGWREKFEKLAQQKLTQFASCSEPEIMKPLQFWFRLEKANATFF